MDSPSRTANRDSSRDACRMCTARPCAKPVAFSRTASEKKLPADLEVAWSHLLFFLSLLYISSLERLIMVATTFTLPILSVPKLKPQEAGHSRRKGPRLSRVDWIERRGPVLHAGPLGANGDVL